MTCNLVCPRWCRHLPWMLGLLGMQDDSGRPCPSGLIPLWKTAGRDGKKSSKEPSEMRSSSCARPATTARDTNTQPHIGNGKPFALSLHVYQISPYTEITKRVHRHRSGCSFIRHRNTPIPPSTGIGGIRGLESAKVSCLVVCAPVHSPF